jgi:hypothetical protein
MHADLTPDNQTVLYDATTRTVMIAEFFLVQQHQLGKYMVHPLLFRYMLVLLQTTKNYETMTRTVLLAV